MIEFLNESNVPQPDGTKRRYPKNSIAPKDQIPAQWLANALQRGAVRELEPMPNNDTPLNVSASKPSEQPKDPEPSQRSVDNTPLNASAFEPGEQPD